MRVSLINLGDGARCVYDAAGRIVSVGVGEIVDADLSDATVALIKKFRKTDTLLVAPEGMIDPPVKLKSTLEILSIVDDEPYDQLLRKFFQVIPQESGGSRPTRTQMRLACKGLIEAHLSRAPAPKPPTEEGSAAPIANQNAGQPSRRRNRR
jgi:hypothetical protein